MAIFGVVKWLANKDKNENVGWHLEERPDVV